MVQKALHGGIFLSLPKKSNVYTDIVDHPSLFKYAKTMNVQIPSELYNYSVKNETGKTTMVSATSLDVLKIALWKLLSHTHADKRIMIKRTWSIMFRELKEDETINLSLFNDDDGDY